MDSAAKIVRCFQAAAQDAGLPAPPDNDIRNIIGLGLKDALDIVLPDVDDVVRARVVEHYRHHFVHLDTTETPLFPGVVDGLRKLTEDGYWLAIATGKARRGLDRVLSDAGISHYFCATRCADEARSKPHPQMLHDLLACTGVDASRAVMIGDTTYDLDMAVAASMEGVAVCYGAHERERLLSCKPIGCFDSFVSVCQWLETTAT